MKSNNFKLKLKHKNRNLPGARFTHLVNGSQGLNTVHYKGNHSTLFAYQKINQKYGKKNYDYLINIFAICLIQVRIHLEAQRTRSASVKGRFRNS